MSLVDNKTFELFSGFMPFREQIGNSLSTDIYEVMVYDDDHFKNFSPANTFTKWALTEVSVFDHIPESMERFTLEEGLYAVFNYKGLPKDFGNMMRYILMEWLPNSKYVMDQRPHFNVLGNTYKKDDPESEEDVYIPIRVKD